MRLHLGMFILIGRKRTLLIVSWHWRMILKLHVHWIPTRTLPQKEVYSWFIENRKRQMELTGAGILHGYRVHLPWLPCRELGNGKGGWFKWAGPQGLKGLKTIKQDLVYNWKRMLRQHILKFLPSRGGMCKELWRCCYRATWRVRASCTKVTNLFTTFSGVHTVWNHLVLPRQILTSEQAAGKSLSSLTQTPCSIPWKLAMFYQVADFLISELIFYCSILCSSFTICPFEDILMDPF